MALPVGVDGAVAAGESEELGDLGGGAEVVGVDEAAGHAPEAMGREGLGSRPHRRCVPKVHYPW